jgi:glycosyltransferase involved in cell wall biosynthesis
MVRELRQLLRRALRAAWWTVTLQLPRRLKERGWYAAQKLSLREQARPVAVVIDDRWPEPDRDSGSLDAINLIDSLVTFGYYTIVAKSTGLAQEPRYLRLLREKGAMPYEPQGVASVRALIQRHAKDVSVFILTRMGAGGQFFELIRENAPDARLIFNAVDLHFLREARAALISDDRAALKQAARTRGREKFLAAHADLTIIVSDTERDILAHAVPGAKLLHLPLARQLHRPRLGFQDRVGIGFVGGFAHQPNIDAMRYFLAEIWPQVDAALPGVAFDIVGAGLPPDVLSGVPGNVRYLGPIDDLNSWLDGLRLSVAPLRFGAGAKGKVASSLCVGLPCVASPVATEGMGLISGKEILVAPTEAEFSAQIVRLYSDPELWEKISSGAWRFAEEALSVQRFQAQLRNALFELNLPALPKAVAGAEV